MSVILRERDQDGEELERYAKRPRMDGENVAASEDQQTWDHVLPPSHSLLGVPLPQVKPGHATQFLETDVGISEYIGKGEAKIGGIIKQRYVNTPDFREGRG